MKTKKQTKKRYANYGKPRFDVALKAQKERADKTAALLGGAKPKKGELGHVVYEFKIMNGALCELYNVITAQKKQFLEIQKQLNKNSQRK